MRETSQPNAIHAPEASPVPVDQITEARRVFARAPLSFELQLEALDPGAGFDLCAAVAQTGFAIRHAAYHDNGTLHLRLSDEGQPDPAPLERLFAAQDRVTLLRWTNVVGARG